MIPNDEIITSLFAASQDVRTWYARDFSAVVLTRATVLAFGQEVARRTAHAMELRALSGNYEITRRQSDPMLTHEPEEPQEPDSAAP